MSRRRLKRKDASFAETWVYIYIYTHYTHDTTLYRPCTVWCVVGMSSPHPQHP